MPTSRSSNQCIGITLGDPSGIGPEVVAKALAKHSIRDLGRFVVIGDITRYRAIAPSLHRNCTFIVPKNHPTTHIRPGSPSAACAESSLMALETAVTLLKLKRISSLVTAPVCKESIVKIRPSFQGHTEYLAKAFKRRRVGMMFVSGRLRSIIVTRHIPIRQVSRHLNRANVYDTIHLAHGALKNIFKIKRPRLAVCGLNPHAGEGGTIGTEEITKIIPAIKRARRNRMDVVGPFAADTLFSPDIPRRYDAVVAMYHDQGLIPVKTLCLNKLVNLTIGLPVIRTSPAHGTAFDIAGKGIADPSSMCEAIKLASRLSV